MARKKRLIRKQRKNIKQRREQNRKNKPVFREVLNWFAVKGELFTKNQFHGNIKWEPEQLVAEALIWSWQEAKNVTDAFDQTLEICQELGAKNISKTYTSFMNALDTYADTFSSRLRERHQELAEQIAGRFWRRDSWVLMGFDGSRATTPRTISNEKAFCAPNYGKSNSAKYRKRKTKGMRRKQNEKNKPQPQTPQTWITMMWHMSLRLPWTWRLGPSNSSERGHVMEMLQEEQFPENTLFCGDAGFVGYPLWNEIINAGRDFLVRVGANVKLLSEMADIKKCGGGIVLCWPKDKMNSGAKPLRLRLVQVKIGKTKMWLLTSVLEPKNLSKKMMINFYKMRWGIEIEFRGLKQTIDKHKLRCRNSNRVLVELDWSIRAMAVAELIALREQIPQEQESAQAPDADDAYDPKDRSLANTIRALRQCMRNLNKNTRPRNALLHQLSFKSTTTTQTRNRVTGPRTQTKNRWATQMSEQ
jgi:hypothetical protein